MELLHLTVLLKIFFSRFRFNLRQAEQMFDIGHFPQRPLRIIFPPQSLCNPVIELKPQDQYRSELHAQDSKRGAGTYRLQDPYL